MTAVADDAALQGQCPRGVARRAAAARHEHGRQFRAAPRRRRRAAAGVRGVARQRARHQEPHARASRSLSGGLRAAGHRARAATCTTRATPRRRGRSSSTSAEARGAKRVTKGKSMISEEIGLNQALEAAGIEAIETDLGEYIIQLRHEAPIAHHRARDPCHPRRTSRPIFARRTCICRATAISRQPETLLAEAREILRQKFLSADIGVTGANFLIAETGTSIIVTNEGNGDLTQILPKVHVVIASLEKITPTLDDAAQLLRVLARSATGQDMSVYTTLLDRAAPAGRSRRAGGISRHPARQRPLVDAGGRVRRHAALHPLRRLHEPLPGLSGGRRPRLRLGLSRPDGRGADAFADRRRRRRAIAERLDLLRALRGGLPDAHSVAEDDAALARARVRAPSGAGGGALRAGLLGVLRQAPGALSLRDRYRDARDGARRAGARPVRLGCRWRAAGRATAILPAPQGAHISGALARQERSGAIERARRNFRQRAPLAACDRRRSAAAGRGRRSAGEDARPASSPRAGRAALATFKAEALRAAATLTEIASAAEIPAEIARYPARAQSAGDAADRRRPAARRSALGARRRWRSAAAPRTAMISTPPASPSRGSPRPARWRSSPAPTIRRRSTFCPTITWSSCSPKTSSATWRACSRGCARGYGAGQAPRTLNFVTGPSRSADIEQTLLFGAHGPRRLHVVVVTAPIE